MSIFKKRANRCHESLGLTQTKDWGPLTPTAKRMKLKLNRVGHRFEAQLDLQDELEAMDDDLDVAV